MFFVIIFLGMFSKIMGCCIPSISSVEQEYFEPLPISYLQEEYRKKLCTYFGEHSDIFSPVGVSYLAGWAPLRRENSSDFLSRTEVVLRKVKESFRTDFKITVKKFYFQDVASPNVSLVFTQICIPGIFYIDDNVKVFTFRKKTKGTLQSCYQSILDTYRLSSSSSAVSHGVPYMDSDDELDLLFGATNRFSIVPLKQSGQHFNCELFFCMPKKS